MIRMRFLITILEKSGRVFFSASCILVIISLLVVSGCVNLDYNPNRDIVFAKFKPDATVQSVRVIDSGGDDLANSLVQTSDNNFIIIASLPGNNFTGAMKYSDDGKSLWNLSFSGTPCGLPVVLAKNGDILTGAICRISPDGKLIGNYPLPINGYVQSIIETTDNGYIVGGARYDRYEAGSAVQYDSTGNLTGQRPEAEWNGSHMSIEQTFIAKVDPQGKIIWQTFLGKEGFRLPVMFLLELPGDGGYVAQTSREAIRLDHNGNYVSVVHLNYEIPEIANGSIRDQSLANLTASPDFVFYNATGVPVARMVLENASDTTSRTRDGGYISAGLADHGSNKAIDGNLRIVRLNPDGTVVWERNVTGILVSSVNEIIQTSEGGYAMIGENDKEWR